MVRQALVSGAEGRPSPVSRLTRVLPLLLLVARYAGLSISLACIARCMTRSFGYGYARCVSAKRAEPLYMNPLVVALASPANTGEDDGGA